MHGEESGRRTIELWMRSFAPSAGENRDRTIERVRALARNEAIAEYEIDIWGREIERSDRIRGTRTGRRIHDRLEQFEQWAERTDRSLEPFFRTKTVEAEIVDRQYRASRLPALALAEFEGERLVHVAPSRAGERTIDVADRLDTIERELREAEPEDRSREVAGRSD